MRTRPLHTYMHGMQAPAHLYAWDAGPFNSWDRQPFLTTVLDGSPSTRMAWRTIHHNFFIDNYSPQENVDNDDGSAYYKTHDNFFVYGGNGMKNDFGGHDNHHVGNIYAYVGQGIGFYDAPMVAGHEVYNGPPPNLNPDSMGAQAYMQSSKPNPDPDPDPNPEPQPQTLTVTLMHESRPLS